MPMSSGLGRPSPTRGPLTVHAGNPRYFADSSGRAVLLAGSHTWATLQEAGPVDPPAPFDWEGWVEFMVSHDQLHAPVDMGACEGWLVV